MTVAFGVGACIGFAEESIYGTALTPTNWTEIESESIQATRGAVLRPTLRTRSTRYYQKKKYDTSGSFTAPVCYRGNIDLLFKHALGSVATGAANGDSAYVHTFTCADAIPVGLTLEVHRDPTAATKAFQFPGCQIGKLTLKQEAEAPLMAEIEVTGNGTRSQITATTESYPTVTSIDWDDFALTMNGTAVTPRTFEVTVTNPLADDRYNLGTVTRKGLGPSGPREVTGTVELEFDGLTQVGYFENLTEANLLATWTGPTAAGSTAYAMTVQVPRAVFDTDGMETADEGPYILKMPFKGVYDITNGLGEIQMTMTNLNSSV